MGAICYANANAIHGDGSYRARAMCIPDPDYLEIRRSSRPGCLLSGGGAQEGELRLMPGNMWRVLDDAVEYREKKRGNQGHLTVNDGVDRMNGLFFLEGKIPTWNEDVGAYVMNFHGRVTMASVKNLQMTAAGGDDDAPELIQFGRTGTSSFTLDVMWPLSIVQAFALALCEFNCELWEQR